MFSGLLFMLCWIGFVVLVVAGLWMVFTKAGKPGWAAIVPIYNLVVMIQIAGRPIWWIVLLLIPLVNVVVGIILTIDIAKSFGKDVAYGIGLVFLPFIFYPMLAFGTAKYQGPSVTSA